MPATRKKKTTTRVRSTTRTAAVRSKPAARKSWRQKLEEDHPNHGKLTPIPQKMQKRFGRGKMLIPRPLDIDALIRGVRKGKLITQGQIREHLADAAGAQQACALCTGIFVRIVAEAAEEDRAGGRKRVTPWWRTIKDDGKLNEKLPGGAAAQAALLRAEGFKLEAGRGKQPPRVKDHHKYLIRS